MDNKSFNRDAINYDMTGSVSGFLKSASARSDQAALIHDGQTWSYAEVLEEARRWASRLRECLPSQPVQRMGIFVHTGTAEHVGKIAALLAGITFVPLNPKFPAQRIAEIIEQASISIIIVDGQAAKKLGEIIDRLRVKPTVILPMGGDSRFAGGSEPPLSTKSTSRKRLRFHLRKSRYRKLVTLPTSCSHLVVAGDLKAFRYLIVT
ncbi:AMP-binding protein [Actinomadura luteofluorescens]|uniref:AMP-binding protein n=1 Tax=Actinomadura luteofluorescens TaxID=46163 RepID=UPI0036280B0E